MKLPVIKQVVENKEFDEDYIEETIEVPSVFLKKRS